MPPPCISIHRLRRCPAFNLRPGGVHVQYISNQTSICGLNFWYTIYGTNTDILPKKLLGPGYPCSVPAFPWSVLAIPGVSLLVLSQFQDVPNSSCLTFYQQYINSYNKLYLPGTMIWYIFQKLYLIKENFFLYVWTMSEKVSIKRKSKH